MKIAGPAASERNAALKKLWKNRHFRLAASGILLTLLGLSFSLAGRETAGAGPLTETVLETGETRDLTGTVRDDGTLRGTGGADMTADGPQEGADDASAPGTAPPGEPQALLHVFVCGSVCRPDVYALPEGSRITDAVRAAGGFSEDAARDALNLAELLTDGEKIRIPSEEEWRAAEAAASTGGAENASGVPENASGTSADRSGGRIDLNSASQKELMTLPGIGESKAARIIAWREQHGPFRSTGDLMRIPGIKQATYNELKDLITAE